MTKDIGQARDLALDQTKGLLIVLVVIGHLVSGAVALPGSAAWYVVMRQVIYLFHMPAFFFVSGIIFSLSAGRRGQSAGVLILRRADRFLVPYFLMGIVILCGKYGSQFFVQVDNFRAGATVFQTISNGLYDLFVNTADSPASSIWFLLAYFICLVGAIPLSRIRNGAWWMLGLTVILFVAPRVPLFHLDKLADNAIFFALGWLYRSDARWSGWLKHHVSGWAVAVILGLLVVPALKFGALTLFWRILFGTGAALVILWRMEKTDHPLLARLGQASMIIYVFNTPIIGMVRAVFVKLGIFDSAFLYFLLAALFAAIAIPLLLRRLVVLRSGILAKYLG